MGDKKYRQRILPNVKICLSMQGEVRGLSSQRMVRSSAEECSQGGFLQETRAHGPQSIEIPGLGVIASHEQCSTSHDMSLWPTPSAR